MSFLEKNGIFTISTQFSKNPKNRDSWHVSGSQKTCQKSAKKVQKKWRFLISSINDFHFFPFFWKKNKSKTFQFFVKNFCLPKLTWKKWNYVTDFVGHSFHVSKNGSGRRFLASQVLVRKWLKNWIFFKKCVSSTALLKKMSFFEKNSFFYFIFEKNGSKMTRFFTDFFMNFSLFYTFDDQNYTTLTFHFSFFLQKNQKLNFLKKTKNYNILEIF